MTQIRKKWIIIAAIGLPFILGFIISLPRWPYWRFAGNDAIWLNFWASYLGAIGSVIMAYIAYRTLKFSEEQNRPRIYPSVEIVVQKQYDPQAQNEENKWYNEPCYCLRIKNYGIQSATNIKLKVRCTNEELNRNETFRGYLNRLGEIEFALGSKEEKLLYIFPADVTPAIRRNEKRNNNFWYDEFIAKFKMSEIIVELSYREENQENSKVFIIPISHALSAQTTLIQVLDSINRNLDKLQASQGSQPKESKDPLN